MSNCQKKVKSQKLLKYKHYKSNFELSSKRFLQRIQIQDFFFAGGGGGEEEGLESEGWGHVGSKNVNYKHESSQNSCTQHIVFVTIYISKEKEYGKS